MSTVNSIFSDIGTLDHAAVYDQGSSLYSTHVEKGQLEYVKSILKWYDENIVPLGFFYFLFYAVFFRLDMRIYYTAKVLGEVHIKDSRKHYGN